MRIDEQTLILSGGEEISVSNFKKRLIEQQQDEVAQTPKFFKTSVHYKGRTDALYAYCANHRLKGYHKKQRLVISFKEKDLSGIPRYSISNQLNWFASTILRIRRHRWPIETFHQEGKDEGLNKYQLQVFWIKSIISWLLMYKYSCSSLSNCASCSSVNLPV